MLLGDDEAARAAGHYVPFVLWFNTVAGLAYIVAGLGLWLLRRWAAGLSFVIAASSLAVLFAFGVHIAVGGAYELRTLIAMTMRSAVWSKRSASSCASLPLRVSFASRNPHGYCEVRNRA